jgi:hypothetical protein
MCSAAIRTLQCMHNLIYCLPPDLQQPLDTTLLASVTNFTPLIRQMMVVHR